MCAFILSLFKFGSEFVFVSVFQGVPLSVCAIITLFAPAVIPAKAGIQEGIAGVLRACRPSPACKEEVIPASREWDCVTGFLGLRSRRGSTTCIHAGEPSLE